MKGIVIAAAVAAAMFTAMPAIEANAFESNLTVAGAPKKEVKTVVFKVGLHCQNCVKKVKENISFEKGVKGLEVSLDNKTVTVTYDPTKTDVPTLKKAIEKLGYKAEAVPEKA